MGTRVVHVVTGDRLLRRAILAHLRQAPEFVLPVEDGKAEDALPSEVIISTTSDFPAARVSEVSQHGVQVVVLAAIPKNEEGVAYQDAGAKAYIPMTSDGMSLVKKIREAVS